MGKVIAICISEEKGTQKHSVQERNLLRTGESKGMPMPESGTDR